VLVASHAGVLLALPVVVARGEAAVRNAILQPAIDMAQVRDRFELGSTVENRRELAMMSDTKHQAFDGPMWRFLLYEPVRPDIDLRRNQTYYGVKVTLLFGS
jgi:hypothetical protein